MWKIFARKSVVASFMAGTLLGVTGTTFGATLLGSSRFSDVPAGSYYDAPVGRLADQGIIRGNPDGTFKPTDFVSRADVAVMIDRAINGESGTVTPRRSSSSSSKQAEPTTAGSLHFTTDNISVGKGSKRSTISIIRTGGKTGEVRVDYSFGGGTAELNLDYGESKGTVVFADGETTKNISVSLMRTNESPQRTLEASLSNPTGGAALGSPSKTTLLLLGSVSSSGTASSSSSSAASAAAGAGTMTYSASAYGVDEEGATATITVVRTGGSSAAVGVNYATSNGTATSGTHYTPASGTLTFAAGETSKTFTIPILNNTSIDGNKTVNLSLSAPTGGAAIGTPGTAVLTIWDTEAIPSSATGSLRFSSASYLVSENAGSVTITVQRTLSVNGSVTVTYTSSPGTATVGSDYTATSGTLTFAPGETAKVFQIPILKDSTTENEESINLTLSSQTGPASLGDPSNATVKIY